jgi:hypothetical protein
VGTGAGSVGHDPSDRERIEERIRALRSRVYGRDPRPDDVAALAAALAELPPAPAGPGAEAGPIARPLDETPPPVPQPRALSRALAAVRALSPQVLLAGTGIALVAALAGATGLLLVDRPSAADAAPVTQRFIPAISVAADPALLRRPAGSADRTTALVGPDLLAGSFRRLVAYPAAGVTLWAARDRFGQTCLVAADIYYRTACADAATVKASGLVLVWSSGPGDPASTTESYTAVWRGGRLRAGRSAR